ncbi:P-loop NTPase family protein [Acidithiobacillus ferriphilus]|uniref:hypothetical protein n=1 Tax=Acidithiobacillus ferriphilus TaxID=1689834 RepID=UPI002DB970E1|nr:hypothetical protein [Acidithiobacillus ferriphilus]MEB8536465.1 hypothetical protein [Acidithiobacillus ferriphilus]
MTRATQVFTPGSFPTHTFVDDHLRDKNQQLMDALDTGSMLVSISGPSKSGKTVFVEQCLGRQNLIQVTGAGVTRPEELWLKVFDIVGTPIPQYSSSTLGTGGKTNGSGQLEGGIVLAKGKASISVESSHSESETLSSSYAIDCLQLLIREVAKTDFVIFIDDFHYIKKETQQEVARQIKEAIRQGVKFICASVPYHADDVIRSNPDLRGRVFSIDFQYWGKEVLQKIAYKGFAELGISYQDSAVDFLASEAAGSPQLMQYLCLNSCYELGVRESDGRGVELVNDRSLLHKICKRTVLSTDYGSIVEKMKEGPKTRGSDRLIYNTTNGWSGDVYRLLVKALSLDPPTLTFRYGPLNERIVGICQGSPPSGSSITGACDHSARIVNDSALDRIVEWDGESDVFDIRDPYFLFFLRWSDVTDS